MFSFDWDDEHALLAETARQFAAEQLAPKLRAAEQARDVDASARDAFAQIGLAELEWSEEQGGAGLGALARCVVNEELGAADPGAALALDRLGPAFYAIAECGGEAALSEFAVPLLRNASARAALVLASDTSIEIDGQRATGDVVWVPTDRVDLLVALDESGVTLIGGDFEATPLRGAGLRAAGGAELRFDGVPVVGRFDDRAGVRRALARVRLYTASLLLGVLRQACDFSREYALERVAFGRPIAHHQSLAFLITDMRMAVDGARLLLHDAAWRFDHGLDPEAAAATAFVETVEASAFVGPNGVQILGGHGFMQDYPVEKFMRESRALGLLFGGVDAAREVAGEALCAGGAVELSHGEAA